MSNMTRYPKLLLCWILLLAPAANGERFAPGSSKITKPVAKANTVDSIYAETIDGLYTDELVVDVDVAEVKSAVPPSQETLITVGCLLAANSGFLNGLGLSGLLAGRQQAVTAVTNAYTTSAMAAGIGSGGLMITHFVIVAGYLGGACLNGFLNPKGVDWSKKPTALLLAAALVLGGALDYVATDRFFILLSVAMGLQNSWTTMLISGDVLRTGHLSGITSDIGTFLGQVLRGNTENAWKLKVCATLAASFWTGGLFSVVAAKKWTEFSFLTSVGLYLVLWSFLSFRRQSVAIDAAIDDAIDYTTVDAEKEF